MTWKEVIAKEWKYVADKKYVSLLILLLLPLAYTLCFGAIYMQGVVKHIPLVIYDEDQSSVSRSLIQCYNDSDKFEITGYVTSEEDMENMLQQEKALTALYIPKDFSKEVRLGRGGRISITINSVNNTIGNAAIMESWKITRTFNVGVARKLLQGINVIPAEAEKMAYPVTIGVRVLNNPTTAFSPFMLAGLGVQGVQIAIMITVCPLMGGALGKSLGEEGISTFKLYFSRILIYFLMALPGYMLVLVCSSLIFAVPIRGELWKFIILGSSYILNVLGILTLLGTFGKTKALSLQIPMLYIMPGTLYSGLSWPVFAMNEPAFWYAAIMPIRYTAVNVRYLMLGGYVPHLLRDVCVMAAGAAILSGLSCMVYDIKRNYERYLHLGFLFHHK